MPLRRSSPWRYVCVCVLRVKLQIATEFAPVFVNFTSLRRSVCRQLTLIKGKTLHIA